MPDPSVGLSGVTNMSSSNRGFITHAVYRAPDGTRYRTLPTQQADWDQGLGSAVIESSAVASDCGRCVLLSRTAFENFELLNRHPTGAN